MRFLSIAPLSYVFFVSTLIPTQVYAIQRLEEPNNSPTEGIAQSSQRTERLNNPNWQSTKTTESYVDVRNLRREGTLVTFDSVDPDATYYRSVGNCANNQIRTLRIGWFKSASVVEFDDVTNNPAYKRFSPATPHQQELLDVACRQ